MRVRFLFRNDDERLYAFSLHENGANLPAGAWRRTEEKPSFIYQWDAADFDAMAKRLRERGFYIFKTPNGA